MNQLANLSMQFQNLVDNVTSYKATEIHLLSLVLWILYCQAEEQDFKRNQNFVLYVVIIPGVDDRFIWFRFLADQYDEQS